MAIDWSEKYWDWLTESALPLWMQEGVDPLGGFQESLTSNGQPTAALHRTRVQGRQSFVFAFAERLGWHGAWAQIAPVGLAYLDSHCRRPDGLYATLTAPGGKVIDDTAMTYDQAFALLAAAELNHLAAETNLEHKALDLLNALSLLRAHPEAGFVEQGGRYLSNPNMHMLEACLAWIESGGQEVWRDVASGIVKIALERMIDPKCKLMREVFGSDWRPLDSIEGLGAEPGHQFEWAWLLERWAQLEGDNHAHETAQFLFQNGQRGIDPVRGVAIDEIDTEFRVRRGTARLWPQTEWLKAACIFKDPIQRDAASTALWKYLQTTKAGLWYDKMDEDGCLLEEEAVPASSLYHIISAAAALQSF